MGKKPQPQALTVTTSPEFAFVSRGEPVALGNVFAVAHIRESFLIVVGQAPPRLARTTEEVSMVATKQQPLSIRTVAQFMLPENRVQELVDNLQASLAASRKARGKDT